jgi:ribonuclease inhibitor
MKEIVINGARITSVEAAHSYLAHKFNFPEFYGRNLDALWDILSTTSVPTHVAIINANKLHESLGEYGQSLINVFVEADQTNANLHCEII